MIFTKQILTVFLCVGSLLVFASPLRAQSEDQSEDGEWFEGDTYQDEQWVDEGQGPGDEPEVDQDYFFEQLAPYGDWIWTPEYGWVWKPAGVAAQWRPYTYGQWAYTDYGWTWSSYYPWGWATFHYGRWALIEQMGWVWVPGQTWAPAWVMWRYSGAYVGWSPLLAGYDPWYGWAYYPVFYSYWTFVDWDHFCDPYPNHHYVPRSRSKDVFRHTYFPRRCRDGASGVCVRGPSHQIAQKVMHKKIIVRHLENTAPRNLRKLTGVRPNVTKLGLSGNTLRVFRPRVLTPSGKRIHTRTVGTTPGRSVDLGIIPNRTHSPKRAQAVSGDRNNFSPFTGHKYPEAKPGATIKPKRPRPGPYGTNHPAYNYPSPVVHKTHAPGNHKPSPTMTKTPSVTRTPSMKRVPVMRRTTHSYSSTPKVYTPAKSSTKSYKPSGSRSSPSRSRSSFHPRSSSSRSSSHSSSRSSFHSSSGGGRHRR